MPTLQIIHFGLQMNKNKSSSVVRTRPSTAVTISRTAKKPPTSSQRVNHQTTGPKSQTNATKLASTSLTRPSSSSVTPNKFRGVQPVLHESAHKRAFSVTQNKPFTPQRPHFLSFDGGRPLSSSQTRDTIFSQVNITFGIIRGEPHWFLNKSK